MINVPHLDSVVVQFNFVISTKIISLINKTSVFISILFVSDFAQYNNKKKKESILQCERTSKQKLHIFDYFVFFRRDLFAFVVGVELATAVVGLLTVT